MLTYLVLSSVLIVLPLAFSVALLRSRDPDRLSWLLKALYTGAFVAYVSMMGRWDLVSIYVRYAITAVYAAAVLWSLLRASKLPFIAAQATRDRLLGYLVPAALLVMFGGFAAWAARAYSYSEPAVELTFPLRDGRFYVGQGGNSRILNYHNVNRAQQYALDIVELNRLGMRAQGLAPQELQQYVIFDESIHSPCDGRVEASVDGLPDHVPPATDRNNVAGNHVIIACEGALVLLAHMREGSVAVRRGERVSVGTVLGAVGNSGNTSEPHLHIHAVRQGSGNVLGGNGVPIRFNGTFPVRNTVIGAVNNDPPTK